MRLLALGALVLATACGGGVQATSGVAVKMTFTRATLYDAPFPSDDLLKDDGTIALDLFQNPKKVDLLNQGLTILGREAHGFSTTAGVFFQLTAAPGPLPTMAQSVTKESPVFLVGVDPASPDYGVRVPVQVSFHADGGPYGSANLLSLIPLQGRPLLPNTRYAAGVLRDLKDSKGNALGVSIDQAKLTAGVAAEGMNAKTLERYVSALAELQKQGVGELSGVAVFTTDDPTAAFRVVKADALSKPLPAPGAFTLTDTFDDFCVFSSTLKLPVYQAGEPPFSTMGGRWVFNREGKPLVQKTETSRLVVTVPRKQLPAAGLPTTVFLRTGGGGDRPLVDRGQHATYQGPAITAGSGPAMQFARAGFAGVMVDGPHGGPRNVTGGDEQLLMFNFLNAGALRDNVRQSALEIVILAQVLKTLAFDATACPEARTAGGAATVSFDTTKLALMGHSMGATIAPLVMANEPMFKAAILSGSGASWIENVIYKIKPLEVRPFAETLIGYSGDQRLVAEDPVLSLVQWAAEPADSAVYARDATQHVLMFQGLVDHYILPRIANAMSLSLGLDLAGETFDSVEQTKLPAQTPLESVLPFSGRSRIKLPASGNLAGGLTGVVVQHPEDGIEDGHEVAYQVEAARREYRCFLESFAKGIPRVPAPSANAGCE